MQTYYIEIFKDGHVLNIASTQANNEEGARAIIDAAARGRGWDGFVLNMTTEEAFASFKNAAAEAAAVDTAAAQDPAHPGLAEVAGVQVPDTEGNKDSGQSETADNTGEAIQTPEEVTNHEDSHSVGMAAIASEQAA